MGDKHDSRKAYRYFTFGTAISTLAAGATGVQAQEEGSSELVLEEVLVTATRRRALNLQDVPIAITAFTEETITTQGFKTLDDYFSQIPSLTFGRVEPGGTTVIMRGCAISGFAFGDNPTTGVYLDDQPITAAGFNPDPRLVDIERVEALAGPQGTTFGDASQCGTLRIITNKPRLDETSSWVDLTGTYVDDGEAGYDASAMLNLPIGDTVAVRLVGFTARDAGFIDNILGTSPGGTFDNAELAQKDVNTTDVYGGRAGLRWAPLDNWTFDLQGVYQKTEQDGFGDAELDEDYFEGSGLNKWEQLRFNPESFDDEWYQIAGTAEGDFGWGVLTATGSYFKREARQRVDATTYLQGFQQINDYIRAYYNPYATIYDWGGDPRAAILYDTETERQTLEVRLSTTDELSSKWSALVGAFYNKNQTPEVFRANIAGMSENCTDAYAYNPGCSGAFSYLSYLQYYYFGTFAKPSDNWFTGIYDSELTSSAIFGEWTYNFTDRFSITLGGRWYDIENERLLIQAALTDTQGARVPNCGTEADRAAWQVDGIPQEGFDLCFTDFRASADESGFVPKLNATWFWQDEKMVYFTYSEGFRRGGANGGRRGSVFATGGPFDAYESDELKNYEIGSKNTFLNGRLQLNATFYHMTWDDIQIQTEDPSPTLFTVGILNFPQAEIDGIEADFSWRATENFTLNGTLGYNSAELSEDAVLFPDTGGERVATKGTRLPLMPEWKTSLTGRFDFSNTIWNATPYVLGTWTYQDETVNSLAGIQASVLQIEPRKTDAFNIVNLRFGLNGDDWSASLFVDNVFNEFAVTFFNERYTQSRATVLPPRTIGINFRKEFGF